MYDVSDDVRIFLSIDVVLLGGGISEHVPVYALKTVV